MKKILLTALLVLTPILASAADWSATAKLVRQSIVEVAIANAGACTGFVIDDKRDYVLTAAHCDNPNQSGKDLYVDLKPVTKIVAKDVKRDLMVVQVEGIDRPALKLAKKDPVVGEEVASYGYGYALEEPLFREAHISASDIAIESARYLAVDSSFVPGQSGGPVVNMAGEVVMIVQLGNPYIGLGVGAEVIEDKVGRYFEK